MKTEVEMKKFVKANRAAYPTVIRNTIIGALITSHRIEFLVSEPEVLISFVCLIPLNITTVFRRPRPMSIILGNIADASTSLVDIAKKIPTRM
jgi:hypothetical protein